MRFTKHILLAAALLAACDSTTEPGGVTNDAALTVDATTGWAYVNLDNPSVVAVANAQTSTAWDIAFNATSVMLNGGDAGAGEVEGFCICQNAAATSVEVLAMTPSSERGAFDAIAEADIPAEGWQSEALAAAVTGWYSYNPVAHTVAADTTKTWKLRLSDAASPAFAKFRVKSLASATQASAGDVTIEYAVQSAAGQPLGAVQTAVLDASTGSASLDLNGDGSWDISISGYTIRVNGGASGTGGVGAVLDTEPFSLITDAGDVPIQVYRGDTFGGVFVEHPWYRYNLTGSHDVSPTYDVYLVRRGSTVWKVQLTGYYSPSGDARHISFRSEKITD